MADLVDDLQRGPVEAGSGTVNGVPLPGGNPALTAADRAALATYPELARLIDLRHRGGWFFQPVQVEGELELLTGARLWPDGWSDAIAMRTVDDACAFRCDPAGGEVWQRAGGLVEVIDGLVELPAPNHPKAPRLVKGTAPRLWVPQSHAAGDLGQVPT